MNVSFLEMQWILHNQKLTLYFFSCLRYQLKKKRMKNFCNNAWYCCNFLSFLIDTLISWKNIRFVFKSPIHPDKNLKRIWTWSIYTSNLKLKNSAPTTMAESSRSRDCMAKNIAVKTFLWEHSDTNSQSLQPWFWKMPALSNIRINIALIFLQHTMEG